MSNGWNSIEEKNTNELTRDAWAQGFFHNCHENWDGQTWSRNFHELLCRDLALFALGPIKNKRVLDVGCGQGEYTITMARMGAKIAGQDLSADLIRVCL